MERYSGVRTSWLLAVLLVINLHLAHLASFNTLSAGRLCVEEGVDCSHLSDVSGSSLSCTPVRDRLDCLKKIRDHEADFGYFEAEDLNIAAVAFKNKYEVAMEVSNGEEVQRVFLLVHNVSNLEPSSMCHPGLNPHRYYPTALYRPTTTSHQFNPNIKVHIEQLSQAWSSACIPGFWSMDPGTDRQLKQHYPQLCHTCLRQSCHADDPYAGSGALQCLLDHAADAAFISDVDLRTSRAKNPEIEKLWHYCSGDNGQGTILHLADRTSNEEEPCDWGRRPLPVIMFAPCNNSECQTLRAIWIQGLTAHSQYVIDVLKLPANTQMTTLERPQTPSLIIRKAGYKVRVTPTKKPVQFCVHNMEEMSKCQDLVMAAEGYGAEAGVGLGCLLSPNISHCYPNIYFQKADVVTLDGGDVHLVTKDFGFQRLLSEVYNIQSASPSSSYYAVAVVRADSNITSFNHLKGRKSCHTGIGKTAGWKLPVATLLQMRLIDPQHCNYVSAMAEFFSGGSCAPGAKMTMYNKQSNYVQRLCQLCVGEGEVNCARSSDEPFYSYAGAFRCLAHGGGDVAFVKHTTVPDNTDGSNKEDWAVGLRSEEFKLLCPSNGGSSNTAAVNEYHTCNLALVPAHEVVIAGEMSNNRKKQVRQVLLGVAEVFKENTPGSKTFKLFGKYKGKSDLLFKDSAKGLKALSEDSPVERQRKQAYFTKLDELHSCEVRVCALEGQLSHCEAMAETMSEMGQRFVCVSARDRLDCVQRVVKGQVDMAPLPGNYLQVSPDLRIIAYSRDPSYSQQQYRYRAVIVVRRSTVRRMLDLRGRKACHTGYGRTTGWRIPVALLKREGVIQPSCDPHQSSLEHEIVSVATTFNRACVPGEWATVPDTDAALKERYQAMCSMCNSRTCDSSDYYAGYEGALRCLTQNGGDVAFSKLSVAKDFFADNRMMNISEYGLLCRDGRIVDISSPSALGCFWAARPWNTYVTHGGANDAKVQKLLWALTQAKWKGEEDLENRQWYFNTLGIDDPFNDLLPALDNLTTGEYYAESRMNIVEAERVCSPERERPVRFCVTSEEEAAKCNDLRSMLKFRGVSPDLTCVKGNDVNQCVLYITTDYADMMTLNDSQRFKTLTPNNLADLLSETYAASELSRYYLVGVIKKNSSISSFQDLNGKTTCNAAKSSNVSDVIDSRLTNCLSGASDFFHNYRDAFICLLGSNKDIAFVKHDINTDGGLSNLTSGYLNPASFKLLCGDNTLPITSFNVRECNFGRVPASMVVTRRTESGDRKEDMRHVLLKSSQYFGKTHSFFRLFYDYYSHSNLLFRDDTTKLIPVADDTHANFIVGMMRKACHLYMHHVQSTIY